MPSLVTLAVIHILKATNDGLTYMKPKVGSQSNFRSNPAFAAHLDGNRGILVLLTH